MAEAERRIEEARRTRAEWLDLGDLALKELPASLGELVDLRVLSLGLERITEDGEFGWADREQPELTDLSTLAGLLGLRSLSLAGCSEVANLEPLAGLQALQELYLWNTAVSTLEPIAGLQALEELHLGICKAVSNLEPIAGLQALQKLNLASCKAVSNLEPIAGLQALQKLNLTSCSAVSNLEPIAGLQALQELDLSFTAVSNLKPIAGLQALQVLNLSNTAVSNLEPIAGLQELRYLALYDCRPATPTKFVRVFANHRRLASLYADEAIGVPKEILSHRFFDNCLPRLRAYFAELDLGAETENEVKVILLGNGRVGKTQLCRRFRDQPFDDSVESTHGVQLWREVLRIKAGGQEQTFQVNWWDFGGQDVYHGTHALFLRSRAVFLILWTPELENRDEYFEGEIPLRNQPLAYWFDYVRSLAGRGSPVIVVQSQCDRFADRRPSPARPEGFDFFESCYYSAKKDLGRETLEGLLNDAIRYLLERNGALEIGHGRAEVRRRLYAWRSEDQEREPEERRHRTLTLDDFRALCDEAGGIVSWEHALDYLHHTGVVFYNPRLFSSRILLDQDWALEAVYAVFHRGRAVPWLRESGRFTREDLAFLVWQEHSPEEQRLFLGLMESCGVCFRCGKTAQGEPRYVAPDLLPPFEAVEPRLHAWRKDEPGTPTLRLEVRFFHPAVIRGLMAKIGREAGELAEYWKYGFWLKDGRRDTQILVRFEDTSTGEAPGSGALELKAQGRDPLGLLREIREDILWRRTGEEPEELLTFDGTTVARSALDNEIDGRVLDVHGKPTAAATFAAFFQERHGLEEARQPGETPGMNIAPRSLTEDEKPREVFISYAWGDDTPEGKTRAEVVDQLFTALEGDGFRPVRDRDRIRPGDSISAFMNQLTRADLVVTVISDKYLRSYYCMYEIYRLWQGCLTDHTDLARRMVPIVLPEVMIGSFEERAPYGRYWSRKARKLEKLIRDPELSPSPKSLREFQLVRDFRNDIDDILVFLQDILMPRQLEAHLDDGFPAVLEALRRRVEPDGGE
jgi:internalin A